MGNPLDHSVSAVKKFGGVVDDYIRIHQIMDMSKRYIADWRHRALFHNTFGIHMMEEYIIGPTFQRKDGTVMDTRTVVSEHIKEDLAGVIPTPADFLREMPISHWMSGVSNRERKRLQRLSINGSEEQAIVKETLIWYHVEHLLPDKPGVYLCKVERADGTLQATQQSFSAGSFQTEEGTTVKYWAEFPIGP